MCLSNAIKAAESMGVVARQNQMSAQPQTPAQSPTQVNNQIKKKKQKRRVRPRNLRMRGGPGKRSMFGNQENV
tara:strand:+ start:60 stop:278 length:219 start_codon:yes stop_codon:yes gene_type:complete